MELFTMFTMICLALLGVLLFAGGLAATTMALTLAVLSLRQSKRVAASGLRWLGRRQTAAVGTRSELRPAGLLEKEAHIARTLASELVAAMGLTSISAYVVWALAF